MPIKSQQELYDDYINELQSQAPELTDVAEGSINDIVAGAVTTSVSEISALTLEEFKKTFIDTADGPEITEGADDLQTLAVDHFGSTFARPDAVQATGTVTFSRPTSGAGNCTILAGTVVNTPANEAGSTVRFETTSTVVLTGLSITASVIAIDGGVTGNVQAGTVTEIETTLTDSSVVITNALTFGGGADGESDSEYRETIRRLIRAIRGGSQEAIEAAALNVDGVASATALETQLPVIQYDIAGSVIEPGADWFYIPFVELYVADEAGTASAGLLSDVEAAIELVRAYGVYIKVSGAVAVLLNWTLEITLNTSGPNYIDLVADATPIKQSMATYINELTIGDDFTVATAEAAIMSIWGPSGTSDLTAVNTTVPSGNVATAANEKLVAGVMTIST